MTYRINLICAHPDFADTMKKYAADFNAAAKQFNIDSAGTRNPKQLRIVEVQDSLLTLELTAKVDLPVPAKALRLFTQYLVKHSEIRRYVYHGSLFRSVRAANLIPTVPAWGQSAEVQVMDALTRMLVGELPNREAYFSLFKALLDYGRGMEELCLDKYLAGVGRFAADEARALGHGAPEPAEP